jgi:hypothetical protein
MIKFHPILTALFFMVSGVQAFPPAPYYKLYGVVRDQVGQTITAEGASLILLKGAEEIGRTAIYSDLRIDLNYELKIRIDANRPATQLYNETAITAEATQVTSIATGASHVLALREDLIPAQVARLDQDNVFSGNVGIKRVAATNPLEVEGSASKTTAGNWFANSDRRIKTGVQPLTGALDKLDQVRLVDFRYTGDYLRAHPGLKDKRYLNVIAQEFGNVFPDHVQDSGETLPDGRPILQVDTYPLTIYSAAAVQELRRENEALKRKLAEQDERLRKLEEFMQK